MKENLNSIVWNARRTLAFIVLSVLFSVTLSAQHTAIRTNLLYWATTTPNIGVELKLGSRCTFSTTVGYNAFNFSSYNNDDGVQVNPKLHHWLVMPETKFWLCRAFERHYIGVHALYGEYNAGGVKWMPDSFSDYRYDGWAAGVGLSYGYQWAIGRHWGFEASIGAGYVYMEYDKYRSGACAKKRGSYRRHLFSPTKAALSFIYYIH